MKGFLRLFKGLFLNCKINKVILSIVDCRRGDFVVGLVEEIGGVCLYRNFLFFVI